MVLRPREGWRRVRGRFSGVVALITSYNQKKNCCLPFTIDVLVFKEGRKHTVFPPISAHPLRQIHQASTRSPAPTSPRKGALGEEIIYLLHTQKLFYQNWTFSTSAQLFFLFYFTQLDTSNTLFLQEECILRYKFLVECVRKKKLAGQQQ